MKTIKNMESVRADVYAQVSDYFANVNHKVGVTMVGMVPHLTVCYEDFKPVRTVRTELEALLGKVAITEVHRSYSFRSSLQVLAQMLEDDEIIYLLDKDGGEVYPVRMGELIEERLVNTTVKGA